MEPEQLVPPVEICQYLREHKYPDTLYCWKRYTYPDRVTLSEWSLVYSDLVEFFQTDNYEVLPAPTSGELGEELKKVHDIRMPWLSHSYNDDGKRITDEPHWVWMGSDDPQDEGWCKTFNDEASARAFVWLYLKRRNEL